MTDIRVAAEQARVALTKMCQNFPMDSDMEAAGWSSTEVNEACNAYDAGRAALASLEAALAALPGDTSKEQALDLIGELEAVRTINATEGYILASGLVTLRHFIDQGSQIAGRDGASAAPSDTARLDWLLPNLHPANFGLVYDAEKLEGGHNAEWRVAIDAAIARSGDGSPGGSGARPDEQQRDSQ